MEIRSHGKFSILKKFSILTFQILTSRKMSYTELKVKCAEAITGQAPPTSGPDNFSVFKIAIFSSRKGHQNITSKAPIDGQNTASIFAMIQDQSADNQVFPIDLRSLLKYVFFSKITKILKSVMNHNL